MKITKSQLRKIIKEEVNRVLLEADLTTPEGRANMLAGFLNSKGVKTNDPKVSDKIRAAAKLKHDKTNSPTGDVWNALVKAGVIDGSAFNLGVEFEDWREESFDDEGGPVRSDAF